MLGRRIWLTGIIFLLSFQAFSQEKSLEFFLSEGLENSPVLKDLQNQVRSNSLDSMLVSASSHPQINFDGYMMYAPVVNGYGYSDVLTNGQNLSSTINISQTVFNRKTIRTQYAHIGILNRSLSNSLRISENELKREIVTRYLSACSINNELSFCQDLLNASQDEDRILRDLVKNGLYKQTEYLSFLIELQNLILQIKELQINYEKELSQLKTYCGIGDTAMYHLVLPEPQGVPAFIPANSPLLKRFEIDSLRIENDKLLIDRHYKPEVKWFSDAGLVNNIPENIYQNFGLSLGLSLSMPVYDGNQRKLNYHKLRISEATRRSYKDFYKSQIDQQVRQLTDELEKTKQVIPQLEKQMDLSKELIKLDRLLLNKGEIPVTDYILAKKNIFNIQKELNQYRIKELQIIYEIMYWGLE